MIMKGNLLGTVIGLKMRLVDKAVGMLPEPLRYEVSGLRAEAAGRVKELAGFGINLLSQLSEGISVDYEIADRKTAEAKNKQMRQIELD